MAITRITYFLLFLTCIFASTQVSAADPQAGKQSAAACTGCHGIDGISSSAGFPNLAGQQAVYLANQLTAFKNKTRNNPIMQNMAANLSDNEINNLAAYFSGLTPKKAGGDSALSEDGKGKFGMCSGCHGAKAQGNGNFPRLAGQHPAYLQKQLLAFKNKKRSGGPMPTVAANLSEQDINAIAEYLGSLD